MSETASILISIREKKGLSQDELATLLGTSLASIVKWESTATVPSPAQLTEIHRIYDSLNASRDLTEIHQKDSAFASRGIRQKELFQTHDEHSFQLSPEPLAPILERIKSEEFFAPNGWQRLQEMLADNAGAAVTVDSPPVSGMSAGKNTYTYDAHTYHTKVPPQGIVELLQHYLPTGGLVFDPFAGSGMTGVAASTLGYDCILNELSPAACFISSQFTAFVEPDLFRAALRVILDELSDLRRELYTTHHRNTGQAVEFEYVVWSYRVICSHCSHEFTLWDHCRKYGKNVREHKILTEFPCPNCKQNLKKSQLVRTTMTPVAIAYKQGNHIDMHPLDEYDLSVIDASNKGDLRAESFYPQTKLYPGMNLRQPLKHGLDQVDKFYTQRNLAAMSHLWKVIHRIEDPSLAAYMAFVFTSLYQRVTRFSEFRFWGGSGNTANFNVPYIFKEANVFTTFERKAQTILDHLEATASRYSGRSLVVNRSATSLEYLPDRSVDLIFADPPFGANINYSEMNILWEAWLQSYTDTTDEAIINKFQKKGLESYKSLIVRSLSECYRVLKDDHWLLLVFMNSSQDVWDTLREALSQVGFTIRRVDLFDKQHSTFKQLVSDNIAGVDVVLHCLKEAEGTSRPVQTAKSVDVESSIEAFLQTLDVEKYITQFIHVERETEVDYKTLYSLWLTQVIVEGGQSADFAQFRAVVTHWINAHKING